MVDCERAGHVDNSSDQLGREAGRREFVTAHELGLAEPLAVGERRDGGRCGGRRGPCSWALPPGRAVLDRPAPTIIGLRGAHRRGTGEPHSRQVVALRWTGLPQRGQTLKPASNLTFEGGDMPSGTLPGKEPGDGRHGRGRGVGIVLGSVRRPP